MNERKRKRLLLVLGIEAFCLIILVVFLVSLGKNVNRTAGKDIENGTPIPSITAGIPTPAMESSIPLDEPSQSPDPDDKNTDPNGPDVSNSPEEKEGVDEAFIAALSTAQPGKNLIKEGAPELIFYMQTDKRWGELLYGGTDTIAKYACGPTSMAIVVSSLTDIKIDPLQMSGWASQHGYWYPESGSLHSVIPDTAKAFGLNSEGVENTPQANDKIIKALSEGKLVVALMGPGQFTKGGHFIVLCGLNADGKVIVADPNSEERTDQVWDIKTITSEAKTWAAAGGPFWIIWP